MIDVRPLPRSARHLIVMLRCRKSRKRIKKAGSEDPAELIGSAVKNG